jgi:hypothetical protein
MNRGRLILRAPLILLAALLAGCGPAGTGGSEPSSLASPSPAVTATPSVTAPPAATRAGVVIRSVDPNLEALVPDDGWFVLGPAGYEAQVRQVLTQIDDPDLRRSIEWELKTIEAGRLRDLAANARGPIIALLVLPSAATLEEALDAHRAEVEANAPPHTIVSEAPTTDLFIAGYRTEIHSEIAGGVPTRTIEYLGVLADGRVVVLSGTGPLALTDFPNVLREVARSLRET